MNFQFAKEKQFLDFVCGWKLTSMHLFLYIDGPYYYEYRIIKMCNTFLSVDYFSFVFIQF